MSDTPLPMVKPLKQSGVVLVIVLIFMLALSTIAIFSSRNATLGERQARNETEYQIARQAAEAALRDAERDLYPDSTLPPPTTPACTRAGSAFRDVERMVSPNEFTNSCLAGQCWGDAARYSVAWTVASGSTPGEPWWPVSKGGLWGTPSTACDANGAVPLGRFTGVPPLSGVLRQPDYLIEYLSDRTCDTPLIGVGAALAAADQTTAAAVKPPQMPCYLFRITARGFGPSAKTEVVVQSYFSILKSF